MKTSYVDVERIPIFFHPYLPFFTRYILPSSHSLQPSLQTSSKDQSHEFTGEKKDSVG